MNPALVPFIKMLEVKKLLTFDVIGHTEEHFINRLKLQKYVFLARNFGLDMKEYEYSMYRYGPYSPRLAEDYYTLGENLKLYNRLSKAFISKAFIQNSFAARKFLRLVNRNSPYWLEIAATLLDASHNFDDKDILFNYVYGIKIGYSIEFIESVYNDLKKHGLP